MATQLVALKNQTVLVSIPTLFGDSEARQCRILAAEPFGVWLVSNELTARVLPHGAPDQSRAGPAIFVPFAQIGAIVAIEPAPNPSLGLKPAAAAGSPAVTPATPAKSKPKRSR